jgi:hypothetical protein
MSSEYRPDRRIDPIRPLERVSRNEAMAESDLRREKTYEAARERIADERRLAHTRRRSFAALLKTK